MLILQCCEALKLTPSQTLDSSYVFIMSLLGEYEYILIAKNNAINGCSEQDDEYDTMIDFDSGEAKRVRRVEFV